MPDFNDSWNGTQPGTASLYADGPWNATDIANAAAAATPAKDTFQPVSAVTNGFATPQEYLDMRSTFDPYFANQPAAAAGQVQSVVLPDGRLVERRYVADPGIPSPYSNPNADTFQQGMDTMLQDSLTTQKSLYDRLTPEQRYGYDVYGSADKSHGHLNTYGLMDDGAGGIKYGVDGRDYDNRDSLLGDKIFPGIVMGLLGSAAGLAGSQILGGIGSATAGSSGNTVGGLQSLDSAATAAGAGENTVGGLAALDSAAVAAEGAAPGLMSGSSYADLMAGLYGDNTVGGLQSLDSAAAAAEGAEPGLTSAYGAAGTGGGSTAATSAAKAASSLPTWVQNMLTPSNIAKLGMSGLSLLSSLLAKDPSTGGGGGGGTAGTALSVNAPGQQFQGALSSLANRPARTYNPYQGNPVTLYQKGGGHNYFPTSASPNVLNPVSGVNYGHGGHVRGPGDGQSDSIPTRNLTDGEYVMDADTVASLGNGSNEAGARLLDELRHNLREHKRSAPASKIPPATKSLADYLG